MTMRRLMIVLTVLVLVVSVLVGLSSMSRVSASTAGMPMANKVALENVRDFAAALAADTDSYAVDGGLLYAGRPLDWSLVSLPEGVIVGGVALDAKNPDTVFIGAANELAVYRSQNRGESWLYVPLSDQYIGGVKDIAFDSETRLLYVATDTAGIFRLRDVGSSVTSGGHFMVNEPVIEVATDSTGAGLAFFRTDDMLFRSENGGLSWNKVDTLTSIPTAVEVANTKPPVVYVGTTDRGVLRSDDGIAWMAANDGLGMVPGTRLQVDALAVDPQQPEVLYAATSFLYGSTTLHQTPVGVLMSADGGAEWAPLVRGGAAPVAELLPMAGAKGAVYALTTADRAPLALGMAPGAPRVSVPTAELSPWAWVGSAVTWAVALMAAVWLVILVAADTRKVVVAQPRPAVQMVRTNR
jgi:hypothetical protein